MGVRHETENLLPAPSRLRLARRDTITVPWPRNVLCVLYGHKPARVRLTLSNGDYVQCGRCLRRPLRFASLLEAKGASAHPALAQSDYYRMRRWVGFRSYAQYQNHLAMGLPVRWPGDPDLHGFPTEDDGQDATERITVETHVLPARPRIGVLLRLGGNEDQQAFGLSVHAGLASVLVCTRRFGSNLAHRLVPLGECREVGLTGRLGAAGERWAAASVEWAGWTDSGAPGASWRRYTYVVPAAAAATRLWGQERCERTELIRVRLVLPLPEEPRKVWATLVSHTWSRPRRAKSTMRLSVALEADPPIPTGPSGAGVSWWSVPVTDAGAVADGTWRIRAVTESLTRLLLERAENMGTDWVPSEQGATT